MDDLNLFLDPIPIPNPHNPDNLEGVTPCESCLGHGKIRDVESIDPKQQIECPLCLGLGTRIVPLS